MSCIFTKFEHIPSTPGRRAVGAAEAPFALPRAPDPFHPSATAWCAEQKKFSSRILLF